MVSNLWEDMEKLDILYERLGWNHTDPLTFMIEDGNVVIKNPYHEQRQKNITVTDGDPHDKL